MTRARQPEEPAGSGNDAAASSGESADERPIPSLRESINAVDAELLRLLARRRELSLRVAHSKASTRVPVRDQKREEEILARLIRQGREQGLDAHYVTRLFHEVIEDSLRLQQQYLQRLANPEDKPAEVIRVAFQGIEGAYSHLAALNFFSQHSEELVFSGFNTFAEAVKSVEEGRADYAMLPVENTTSGSINEVYDLLLHTRLSIVGEEKFRVRHCLVGAKAVPLSRIRTIFSHPQAVAQCSRFLASLTGCKVEYFTDTAMSVSKIKEEGDDTQAAIASQEAARRFGLHIVREDIADQQENYTRFLVAARNPREVDLRIPCKTSIVMATSHEAGSLVEPLLVFRGHGINLAKIESRPILGNPWEEMFYLDFEGNIAQERVQQAIDDLRRNTRFIKVLGSYPSKDLPPTPPPAQVVASQPRDGDVSAPTSSGWPAATPGSGSTPAAAGGYRLASRAQKPRDTVVEVHGVRIGGGQFVVIAGPCVVESREQILGCAREVKEHGGAVLRGGCFRPRTSPHGFEGTGFEGLGHLAEAGRTYGLPIVTEVLSPAEVSAVAEKADILQIGARNMQNYALLREVGRIHKPVVLKRGLMASLDELLQAAEHILSQGNQQVILCERGIRTFETSYRNILDLPAIPVLKARSHLPVIVDPSHAAGDRNLVPPLALAARAVGADGIMVEIHPDPEKALSDGPQSLYYAQFEELMARLFQPV